MPDTLPRANGQSEPAREPAALGLPPLLVGGRQAARLIGLSAAAFYRLRAGGGFGPEPIRLRGRVLFRTEEIADWVKAKCPDARTWRELRAQENGRRS